MLHGRAPIPAIPQIRVLELSADVLHGAIRLNSQPHLAVAELVAEEERDATGHTRAKGASHRHAEGWLAHGVERERRVVRDDAELTARRQSRERILEVVRHGGAARRVARRQDAGRCHRHPRRHQLAARP